MMAQTQNGFLHLDGQLFGVGIGEAVASLVRQKYPRDTAKHLSRSWDIDPTTAANVVKGHCSTRTLAKAFQAEGWGLITALGASITGETFEEYEERRLNEIILEAERARKDLHERRARRAALDARAADTVNAFNRAVDDRKRNRAGDGRGEAR